MDPLSSQARRPPDPTLHPDCKFLEAGDWLGLLLGGRARGERAGAILARHGLLELSRMGVPELVAEAGLTPPEARRVAAGLALGRRVRTTRTASLARPRMDSPRRVHRLVGPELSMLERETFRGLLLDGRHRLLRQAHVSVGTLTTSLVHPREVFRSAIREAAAALIVVHNHPSGDPEPSEEDLEVTRRLAEAGELLGIPLVDHVVVAAEGFVSLRERIRF